MRFSEISSGKEVYHVRRNKINRREFLKYSVATGVLMAVPLGISAQHKHMPRVSLIKGDDRRGIARKSLDLIADDIQKDWDSGNP